MKVKAEVTRLKRLAGPKTPPEAYFCVCEKNGRILGFTPDAGDTRLFLTEQQYEKLMAKYPAPKHAGVDDCLEFIEPEVWQ